MYLNRLALEQSEDKTLAPYGFRSAQSRGRAHPDEEPDYRTSFQRDRDRIIHTTAFRRLEHKTQVFVTHEGDYYRTRLTHTIEVAQIGRTLARSLGANEDLVEAICLAHDLGHSPFGHSGEVALAGLMHEYGGFDHNQQSLRIVTELEDRYPTFPGLNLTYEVREGIVKHESEYDVSDAANYEPALRGNLETQIANAADELAYTTHDLDDGLRSGMLQPAVLGDLSLLRNFSKLQKWTGLELADIERHMVIRDLIGQMVTDLISNTAASLQQSQVASVGTLQVLDHNVVGFSQRMSAGHRQLKDFLYTKLYRHYKVLRMQTKAERILRELFSAYQAEPRILPDAVQALVRDRGLERTICDYIAGMTDRFAILEHRRLFDPKERS